MALLVLFCAVACAGDATTDKQPVVPEIDASLDGRHGSSDASVADSPPTPGTPDARMSPPPPPPDGSIATAWSNQEKCENMCQSYCVHLYNCDGTPIDECRMAIDEADGGTCEARAGLFKDIPQSQVEACIADVEAMSCPDFLHMYNTGEGVPKSCYGILI